MPKTKKNTDENAKPKEHRREDIAEKLKEIGRKYREQYPGPLPTRQEMDDFLYDENGLPH